MALIGVHGLQRHAAAVLLHLTCHLGSQALKAGLTAGTVILGIHMDADTLLVAGVDSVVGQLLNGIQRLAAAADKLTEVLALENDLIAALLLLVDLHSGLAVKVLHKTGEEGGNALSVAVAAHRQVDGGHFHLLLLLGLLLLLCLRLGLSLLGFDLFFFHNGCGLYNRPHGDNDFLHGCLVGAVGHADAGRLAAHAQKSALGTLEDLNGHIVTLHAQLGKGFGDGLLLGLADHINIAHFCSP